MMLIEETALPDSALPVTEFRAHLRLGTGFGDDTLQDAVLTSFLRAAMAAVEARTGKILLERGFMWSLTKWHGVEAQELPVAPVSAITRITLVQRDGTETEIDLARVRLEPSIQTPRIRSIGTCLPTVPSHGSVEIRFSAGWGPAWSDLPNDLAQAVLLLAAHYYEFRSETTLSAGCMPFGVTSLIERYKTRRMGFGGAQ
jgi:uncharacterized phiE125 gp8 family phage protein